MSSDAILVPELFVMQVLPKDLAEKGTGARKSNHSFLARESTTFFLPPFLPPPLASF